LFNFSATFTDPRDFITTVYNFNLSEFIKAGYGKHIAILKQEIRAFRDDDDYSNEEKQKVVLKSLMMLAYVSKFYEDIQTARANLYHKPLLLTLVHSVNTQEADLKLFFRELERIGKGEIGDDVWQQAKDELWDELSQRPGFMFEEGSGIKIDQEIFQNLNKADVLEYVYNSSASGQIEVLVRPSDRKELAFKLKTSDKPFALIKIGDISGWLKEELAGYEVNERFEDESYFERLNEDDSEINILMGSRSFYEGWDSNRPNVINFINIGTGTDAKKFILQSVGRGVRIEPLKNKRRRLLPLYNAKELKEGLFHQIKDKVLPIETLFIFGTNRKALLTVIEQLDQERKKAGYKQLSLFEVSEEAKKHRLLIPTYKEADHTLAGQRELAKFEITRNELDLLKEYVEFIGDDRVLLMMYETEPEKLRILRHSLSSSDDYYKHDGRSFKNIDLLARRILDYFEVIPEEFERLKELEDEIRHFKNIKVSLKDITELEQKARRVKEYKDPSAVESELKDKFIRGEITLEEYTEGIKQTARMVREERVVYQGKPLRIKHIANHYYIPIILSEAEKIDYIKHIIKTPSEVKFVNDLERYLQREGNKFKEFDWWLFSKLDESLDQIYIPYYDPKTNRIRHFYPDFVFWLQKGDGYFIVFIDPKGTSRTAYMHKVDGYKEIFEKDGDRCKLFDYEGFKVRVFTFLYTDDVNKLPQEGYKKYWFDNIEKILTSILNDSCSEQVT
jgi:hypothetical protein